MPQNSRKHTQTRNRYIRDPAENQARNHRLWSARSTTPRRLSNNSLIKDFFNRTQQGRGSSFYCIWFFCMRFFHQFQINFNSFFGLIYSETLEILVKKINDNYIYLLILIRYYHSSVRRHWIGQWVTLFLGKNSYFYGYKTKNAWKYLE